MLSLQAPGLGEYLLPFACWIMAVSNATQVNQARLRIGTTRLVITCFSPALTTRNPRG